MPKQKARAHGQGRIEPKDVRRGTFRGRVQINGKRYSVTAPTAREAQRMLDDLIERGGEPEPSRSDLVTVGGVLEAWVQRQRKSAPTMDNYLWAIDHWKPLWDVPLVDLIADDVEDVLSLKAAERNPLGESSLVRLRTVLSMAIDFAMRRRLPGYPPYNCARLAELPKDLKPRRPRRALDVDQARALIDAGANDDEGLLVIIPLFLGLRPGEVAALRWGNVDLEKAELMIDSQRRRNPDGSLVATDPKSDSKRRLTIPPALIEHLRRAKIRGRRFKPTDLVVATRDGKFLDPHNVRRTVARLCRNAGIFEHITPNELRHTAATLASHTGVPLEELRYVMGHKDERMLRGVYVKTPNLIEAGQLQSVLGA